MSDFLHLNSISDLHRTFGLGKPLHPLMTVIKGWPKMKIDLSKTKIVSELYFLGMKGEIRGSFKYGRNSYDFEEGTMVFMSPKQVVQFENPLPHSESDNSGWSIFFHPDLIRKSTLGNTIKDYTFFGYGLNEALHVSDKEKSMLSDFLQRIEIELQQNIDKHSQDLILVNLESILKYCLRFYDRQFYTRTNLNKDFIIRFEKFLENYFSSDELKSKGIPTLSQCGEALNMSGSYLSDLLKLETGRSAKDHIHGFVIEKAKHLLLSSNDTVGQVAFTLGFEYSQHFSKLFKSKTGVNPSEYRNLN